METCNLTHRYNSMKKLIYCLAILAAASATATARPLQKSNVAADAKWLVHLDLDNFKNTQIGQFVIREFVEKKWGEAKAGLKQAFDLDVEWTQLEAITAYGNDYLAGPDAKGILVAQVDHHAFEALKTKAERLIEMAPDGSGFISRLKDSPTLYAVKGDLFLVFPKDGFLVVGKSRAQVEKADQVIGGKAPNLTESKAFADFPMLPNTFFFLALAEGFHGKTALPPQAQVLQQADGGRLVLGEQADNLFINLALRAKTPEVCQQIQQILQGMMALVSLSQQKQPELVELVQNIKVTSTEKLVSLAIQYPVTKVIDKIGSAVSVQKKHDGSAPRKHKAKEKTPAAEATPDDNK